MSVLTDRPKSLTRYMPQFIAASLAAGRRAR